MSACTSSAGRDVSLVLLYPPPTQSYPSSEYVGELTSMLIHLHWAAGGGAVPVAVCLMQTGLLFGYGRWSFLALRFFSAPLFLHSYNLEDFQMTSLRSPPPPPPPPPSVVGSRQADAPEIRGGGEPWGYLTFIPLSYPLSPPPAWMEDK